MTRFLVVPQWQGSSSSRAMQLVDGALAIAGDLPRTATTVVDVPVGAGESLGSGVHRLSSLLRVRAAVDDAFGSHPDTAEPTVVIGGDCGVALAAIARVAGPDLAVLWLDAHADLNDPDSSPSKAFHGMVLRAVLGDGPEGMTIPAGAITPDRVVLGGTRELDLGEELYIAATGIAVLPVEAFADPASIAEAVVGTGATRVHIHVDLDVLDPGEVNGVTYPVPFGARVADVVAVIGAVRERMPLAGASLTEFSPSSPDAAVDDLGAILRLVGALA